MSKRDKLDTSPRKATRKSTRTSTRKDNPSRAPRKPAAQKDTSLQLFNKAVGIAKDSLAPTLLRAPHKEHDEPHLLVPEENQIQQADLVYFPKDKGFLYALVVVDPATGYTDAEPLRKRTPEVTLAAFKKIYRRGKLRPPKNMLQVDQGSEFKGALAKWFKDKKIFIRYGKAARSRQQSYAENRNWLLGKMFGTLQTNTELATNETSREWVDQLPNAIKAINKALVHPPYEEDDEETKPECKKSSCKLLSEGDRVRLMLEKPKTVTGEKLQGKFRAGDIRWEIEPRTIEEVIINPEQPPQYRLSGIKNTAFTRAQLLPVRGESGVSRKAQTKYIVEKLTGRKIIRGRVHYRVKWQGYDDSENTWEPRKQLLEDVPALVKAFERSRR